jgi:hypothetical protein
MAQTNNQELSMRLTVESAEFKKKLLEAQKALYGLQAAGVKAAGGQKQYSSALKAARAEVTLANASYRQATTSLKLHEIQAHKTTGAVTKLGKGQKRSNMAMTQAAYALDDMQYGFQGVQNNIQAMAVSMGASGPLVIGLTLLVVTIGMLVKKFEKARREAKKFKEALGEKQGLMATTLRHVEVVKKAAKGTIAYKESLEILKKQGYDSTKQSLEQYTEALATHMLLEAKLAANADTIKGLLVERMEAEEDSVKASKKNANMIKNLGKDAPSVKGFFGTQKAADRAKKNLDDIDAKLKKVIAVGTELEILFTRKPKKEGGGSSKSESTAKKDGIDDGVLYSHGFLAGTNQNLISSQVFNNIMIGIQQVQELKKAAGATTEELLKSELEQLEAIELGTLFLKDQEAVLHKIKVLKSEIAALPPMLDNGVGLSKSEKEFNSFKGNLELVKLMLDNGIITMDEYIRRVQVLTDSFNDLGDSQMKVSDTGKMFNDQLTSLISGFAEAAGSGDSLGNALLKGLGNMLMQLGGLIVAAGVAMLKFNITMTTGNPIAAIAGGAALIAAGAAVGAFANKAGGGGGSSGSSGSRGGESRSVARPNPVRENARVRNSNLIIPMDKMRYGMQGANGKYKGFN